ncbi:response regulator transcription factor [Cognatishimia sp. SS12]|uniref:response regulator n=1 Tax=Cognatishimia sp. SS12 TaxID=2979465 RepID=UPI00232D5372|nr:response regulator transcription factor [Cognatishimia sp. SS12]MDC0738873.1 response regulator transcription factor [Cognatishimia sp. SS12]
MRILIADDHDLVRETIGVYLGASGDISVESVSTLPEAVDCARAEGPFDLILLDYQMPGMFGLEGLERALAANPGGKIALISGNAPQAVARQALEKGASGFLPKTMSAQKMMQAVRHMAAGDVYFPAGLFEEDSPADTLVKLLSRREFEVLGGLCRGLSNKEIARELDLKEVTIKLHVRTLSKKLNAKNRTHAAMIARDAGLL